MKTGQRKFAAFIIGIIAISGLVTVAIFKGVPLSGDNIDRLAWVVLFMVVAFSGGNAAEWFAKSKEISGATPKPA